MSTSEPGALAERGQLVADGRRGRSVGVQLGEALAAREARGVAARVVARSSTTLVLSAE